MHTLPASFTPFTDVRVVPFDPFCDPGRMAMKKHTILAQLSAERSKPRPDELLVRAYEIWLRVYNRNAASRNPTRTLLDAKG